MEINLWIIYIFLLILYFSGYMNNEMYKDLKKKDKIIELQNKIIEGDGR